MTLPATMTAIGHPGPRPLDAEDALLAFQAPVPQPGPGDLLIKVRATSANPIDTKLRAGGKASTEAPRILGFEAAGEVAAVGAEVSGFAPGDRVLFLGQVNRPGTFADYTLVDARVAGRMPDALSFEDAAPLPLTGLTAFELLFERMGISEGAQKGSVLVVNGAGGVGSIAIQLLRQLTGLTVIATASRPESADWCKTMGAHHVISHREPLSDALKGVGIPAVDFVASLSHTVDHLPEIIKSLKPFGTIGVIDQPRSLDVMPLREKALRLAFEGVFVRALWRVPDVAVQGETLARLAAMVADGRLHTTRSGPSEPLTLQSARAAHRLLESGRAIGKHVLTL